MTLISETMSGQIIEVGEREECDGDEFVVLLDDGGKLRVPCTTPVAREAASALYQPMTITLTLIARPAPRAPGDDARGLPDGTLVTCEHCPTPHPKGDDGRPCSFPKVAPGDDAP